MTDRRAAILHRLAKALGHDTASNSEGVTRRLNEHARGPQPQWNETDVERFLAKLTKVSGTYALIGSENGVVQAVDEYLAGQKLPTRLSAAPHPLLSGINWPEGWEVKQGRARGEDLTGLSVAFCGIAETGSLVFLSGAESPTTLNFLPDDFLCVLKEDRIVPRMEDAWALMRAECASLPRAVNIITGPSRTADVEQTIQLGAHGPRRMHVLLMMNQG